MKTRMKWLGALVLSALITGCGSKKPTQGNNPNAPTVVSTVPVNNSVNVAQNSTVSATFSTAMNNSTITSNSFAVLNSGTQIPGAVAVNGNTAIFTPSAPFPADTKLTASILTSVTNSNGTPLNANFKWNFSTGPPPSLVSTHPANGDTDVQGIAGVTATFNEPLDSTTVTTSTFTLAGPSGNLTGTVTTSGDTVTFAPSSALQQNTSYTATITTAATDRAGNPLASSVVWKFSTGPGPSVISASPSTCITQTSVPTNTSLEVVFNEAMDATSLTLPGTVTLSENGTNIPGLVTTFGSGLKFTPSTTLLANTAYTATISTAAKDAVGNALGAPFSWVFTTAATADTTPPQVTFTSPSQNAAGTPLNRAIVVLFSKHMDPTTLTTATFQLSSGSTNPGPVTLVQGSIVPFGRAIEFIPSASLSSKTVYTGVVTTGATDLSGNTLPNSYVWTFTTGATTDKTTPTVIAFVPPTGTANAPTDDKLNLTYSKVMTPSDFVASNITLNPAVVSTTLCGTPSFTYGGNTATFTPPALLTASTQYTATLASGFSDLAANALQQNFEWTFATGTSTSATVPAVVSTTPANAATSAALNGGINATFNEPIDPVTVTTSTFTVSTGGVNLVGTVYGNGTIATFVPFTNLTAGATYTATLSTGVRDLNGHQLPSVYVWTFTAGASGTLNTATVNLGDSGNFGVLAGTSVTNTGPTLVNGALGTSPGSTVTGFLSIDSGPGNLNGSLYQADSAGVAAGAETDLSTAYNYAASQTTSSGGDLSGQDLGGKTLSPGVYNFSGAATQSGTLTLDAVGDATGVFIFKINGSLTVGNTSSVVLVNGAKASNVFWQVNGNATLGTSVSFVGSILATQSVSAQTGALITGRLLSESGSVILDSNTVTVPAPQ